MVALLPPVLAIFGPTASGKTAVAEALADTIPGEVVSADAMQLYRGLPVLTNQSERPAHLVGIWPLEHDASVAEYQCLAHRAIDEIVAGGKTAIVVGGTGLYLRAALAALDLPPPPAPGARERFERLYDRLGPSRPHALLARRDPAAAAAVHPNDRRRTVRALELYDSGASLRPEQDRLWRGEPRRPTLVFGLDVPPDVLSRRIEERTRRMFERGVELEVERALAGRISATARYVFGLREIAELPREEAIETIALRTRRYAAYQRKWMRRIAGLISVDANREPNEVAGDILRHVRSGAGAADSLAKPAR